jgi:hypothetical protein
MALLAPDQATTLTVTPWTALLVAIATALLGALLTTIGGFINDFFAHRREVRRQKREDETRKEEREREDRIRNEQQAREDHLRIHARRLQAYQEFIEAATVAPPVVFEEKHVAHKRLGKSFIATQLSASVNVANAAEELYTAANKAIDFVDVENDTSEIRAELQKAREDFLAAARIELRQEERRQEH